MSLQIVISFLSSNNSVLDCFCFHEIQPILNTQISRATIRLYNCFFIVHVSVPYSSVEYTKKKTFISVLSHQILVGFFPCYFNYFFSPHLAMNVSVLSSVSPNFLFSPQLQLLLLALAFSLLSASLPSYEYCYYLQLSIYCLLLSSAMHVSVFSSVPFIFCLPINSTTTNSISTYAILLLTFLYTTRNRLLPNGADHKLGHDVAQWLVDAPQLSTHCCLQY